MGLSLSFVFKFLNNIVFVMACTVSMFLAAIISVWAFDFNITVIFVISLFVVSISIYLYYRHNMPWVKANFSKVILGIIVLSIMPIAWEWWKLRREARLQNAGGRSRT
jgi:hypothetical protein